MLCRVTMITILLCTFSSVTLPLSSPSPSSLPPFFLPPPPSLSLFLHLPLFLFLLPSLSFSLSFPPSLSLSFPPSPSFSPSLSFSLSFPSLSPSLPLFSLNFRRSASGPCPRCQELQDKLESVRIDLQIKERYTNRHV